MGGTQEKSNSYDKLTLIAVVISCAVMLLGVVTTVYSNLDGKVAREEVWKIEQRIERMVDQKHNVLISQLEGIRKQQQSIFFLVSGFKQKPSENDKQIKPSSYIKVLKEE